MIGFENITGHGFCFPGDPAELKPSLDNNQTNETVKEGRVKRKGKEIEDE